MDSPYIYQIVRFGVPSSAGFYRRSGEFVQVFPNKRVFKDKSTWAAAWHIFGDEMVVMYFRRSSVLQTVAKKA